MSRLGTGLVLVLALAACDPPSPGLRLRLADGPTQACPSTDCAEVPMACRTWISIRIIDPSDPFAPFLSQCQEVPQNRKRDLCSVGSVELEPETLPLRDLEVQVALYPESAIRFDPVTGQALCPTDIQYDTVNGFPVESPASPALGGRSYYRPGDEEFVVTLGCANLELLNDVACVGSPALPVAATVQEFDSRVSVDPVLASRLNVAVGEPRPSSTGYVLPPDDVRGLDRTASTPPAWSAEVDLTFTSYACLTVLDDAPQSTTSVTCRTAAMTDSYLDFTGAVTGVWLAKASLDQLLAALALAQFPAEGLTIGIVIDQNSAELANQVVTASAGTVAYLSADRTSVGGTATSASGVFVSTDAPFGTVFSTAGGTPVTTAVAVGGLISGKVTIVVLQLKPPDVGGGGA